MLAVIVHLLHFFSSSFNIQKTNILTTVRIQIMSHQITFLMIFPPVWKLLKFTTSFQEKNKRKNVINMFHVIGAYETAFNDQTLPMFFTGNNLYSQ